MEIDKLENALKNPEFRKLLVEYSNEINDPENRRRYEAEFKQFQAEAYGTDCVFLHPQPGYVIKTWGCAKNRSSEKIFINVCSDENVAKPASKRAVEPAGGQKGVHWSIPYSLTKARRDVDKSGLSCLVYDVIFHPNALAMAEKNAAMRGLVNDTALEAVEKAGEEASPFLSQGPML
jgi:dynein assembly factor 2